MPSYKDQQEQLKEKDLATYGFLGYPLLQSADILVYRAAYVPVGEDQVAHVELTRETARRFNHLYGREPDFEVKAELAVKSLGGRNSTNYRQLRKKYQGVYEAQRARLTVTSFVLKALAGVLKKHPVFNASIDEAAQTVVFKEYLHIGLAVDTEGGLLVPVIRDVDAKSMVQLSKDVQELAEKGRDRKLLMDEMRGGTFTISNQGGIGGAHFTPIVNKPEVAILGLGRG